MEITQDSNDKFRHIVQGQIYLNPNLRKTSFIKISQSVLNETTLIPLQFFKQTQFFINRQSTNSLIVEASPISIRAKSKAENKFDNKHYQLKQ